MSRRWQSVRADRNRIRCRESTAATMSFDVYHQRPSIQVRLAQVDRVQSRFELVHLGGRGGSGGGVSSFVSVRSGNPLRISTQGLGELFNYLKAKRKLESSSFASASLQAVQPFAGVAVGKDVFPEINPRSQPLIARQYKVSCFLAKGTFSQIYVAEDLFQQRPKVLKITRRGCHILAFREKEMLDHLAMEAGRGQNYFARCHSLLALDACVVLVMPYYPATLMQLLVEPGSAQPGRVALLAQPQPHTGVFIRPRAIRSGTSTINIRASMSGNESKEVTESDFNEQDLSRLRRIALALVCAMSVMHKECIVHADIKPENCFVDLSESEYFRSGGGRLEDSGGGAGGWGSFTVSPASATMSPAAAALASSSLQPIQMPSRLRDWPADFTVKLGDFGNAMHVSECCKCFEDFEVQTLQYRAPEVLLGLPFQYEIDVWSAGILLIELCIGKPLFASLTRAEAIRNIESKISPLPKTRFSGGKFSDHLFQSTSAAGGLHSQLAWNRCEQMKTVQRLLTRSVSMKLPPHQLSELLDFVVGLTAVDPSHRASAAEAVRHSFLSPCIALPRNLIAPSKGSARTNDSPLKRRRLQNGDALFHSLKL